MADKNRTKAEFIELLKRLEESPHQFNFHVLMRRLECVRDDLPRLGEGSRPVDEPIRLGQKPSLAFAPAALAELKPGKNGNPARLLTYFFGLLGPNGPLPFHLTEYAHDRERNAKDPTFVRFLDIFHHRLMTLFYRAWANAQPTVSHDRSSSDRFASYVGSVFGIGAPALINRDAMPDNAKLHYAGRLACQTRPPEGLEAILSGFFRVPARIDEFVGHWLRLPEMLQTRPGLDRGPEILGKATVIGEFVWDRQSKFRVTLGPIELDRYENFMPVIGNLFSALTDTVRNYAGDEFAWDANFLLRKEDIAELELGVHGRLGWTSWLVEGPQQEDVNDLCLDPTHYFVEDSVFDPNLVSLLEL